MLRLHLYINKLTKSEVTALMPTTSFLQQHIHNCLRQHLLISSKQALIPHNKEQFTFAGQYVMLDHSPDSDHTSGTLFLSYIS